MCIRDSINAEYMGNLNKMKFEKDSAFLQKDKVLCVPMEDIKPQEESQQLECKRKGNVSAYLTLVTKKGTDLVLSNPMFGLENCIESMKFAESLPPYREIAPFYPSFHLGRKTRSSPDITLVLDLDGTLVYTLSLIHI
eukprot:TRINITY_DN9091_c0_g1_i1.p1 TRINITY_DN9091_c0_g1~~TRINITY_DN9091_c0_g1_i1.p1  ORF type:complete len:158 (+),score=31.33 TRINITY_DN9091_c0_g1_i1:62-475(+)